MAGFYGIVGSVHLTDGGVRRMMRAIRRGDPRRLVPVGIAVLAAVGLIAGVLITVMSAAPRTPLDSARATGSTGHANTAAGQTARGAAPAALSLFGLPRVRPSTGDTPVLPGLTMSGAHLMSGSLVPSAPAARLPRA